MKKLCKISILSAALFQLCACSDYSNTTLKGYFEAEDAPDGAITLINENKALVGGDVYVSFEITEDTTFGVYFYDKTNNNLIAYNDAPARITVRGPDSLSSYTTATYERGYDAVTETNYGYHCVSIVETKAKSIFRIMDSFHLTEDFGITVNRKVSVIRAKNRDVGYESLFTLKNGYRSKSVEDFNFFIPSVLYKDPVYNDSSALITTLFNPVVYVKETRMGLPMTMIYNNQSKYYMSLVHADPEITVDGELGGGFDGAINDDLKYASLGFESEKDGEPTDVGVTMCYPCAEGPATFDSGAGWAKRFHQVADNHFHEYKIGMVFGKTENFNDALVDSYEKCYPYVDGQCKQYSNEICYEQNIECLDAETKLGRGTVNTGSSNYGVYGVPWELNLDPTKKSGNLSLQMGFVGQQTSVGAHLYRQGLAKNDNDLKNKGLNMLNFWTSDTIYPSGNKLPFIWYDATTGRLHSQGTAGYATIYLRMLCDGVEGILDAYLYGKEFGKENAHWKDYCIRFANNLVSLQNSDGSFNRAFTKSGGIPGDEFADKNIGYDSTDPAKFKINTPVAIRFLAKMYQLTNNNSYKESLRKAAEYSYTNIYEAMGKYVGGTCDNANVVDKEAAVYAMFGFRYAFEVLGEAKYEKAMKHAAVCSLSWVFMYNYLCPTSDDYRQWSPYDDTGVMGASVIATGHAGVDSFACYIWYDVFKVYQLSSAHNEIYKKAAIALQNASKAISDFDGSRGWKYKALVVEACQVSDFAFKPTNSKGCLWLPWCAVAQMNPIIYTLRDFGVYQLEDVNLNL